eukprot:8389284-Pyramimonas_sp.AAC.1
MQRWPKGRRGAVARPSRKNKSVFVWLGMGDALCVRDQEDRMSRECWAPAQEDENDTGSLAW